MMEKIRTLIIEDEAPAREIIKHYLKELDSVEVIAECADGFSGLKSISELKPDLVFLDIQMPRLTGIELLEVLTEKPEIIFTTAYDQFALKAFELNAVDYLLKPFPKRRFLNAVEKAIDKIRSGTGNKVPVNQLWQKDLKRLLLSTGLLYEKGTLSILFRSTRSGMLSHRMIM